MNALKLQPTVLKYRKMLGIDWDDMIVAYVSDEHPEYEGKTIVQCAEEEGLSNLDMYLKLVELSGREGGIYLASTTTTRSCAGSWRTDLSVFMTDAWVVDKGLQNIAAFQTFPQFFVLAKRYGIPVQNIVHKMAGKTADRFRIPQRGHIRPGYMADLTVIDFEHMRVNERKPDARPEGIEYVYINVNP